MTSDFVIRLASFVKRRNAVMASLVALFGVLGFAAPAQAQVGGAAVVFLKIEPDSRAAGMGNAGVRAG